MNKMEGGTVEREIFFNINVDLKHLEIFRPIYAAVQKVYYSVIIKRHLAHVMTSHIYKFLYDVLGRE